MKDEKFDKELVEHFFKGRTSVNVNYLRYFKSVCFRNKVIELPDFYLKAKKYLEQRFEYFDGYTDALYRIKYGIEHRPKCKTCGKNYTRIIRDKKLGIYKYSDFCCCKCNRTNPETERKRQETCLKVYGFRTASQHEEVKAKAKATFHEHVEEIKAKVIKYNNEHYGVDWYFQSNDFKEKRLAYNMEHYGGPAPICSAEIQAKIQATSFEKYGTYFPSQTQEVKDKVAYTSYQKWGVKNYWASAYNQCRSHSKEAIEKCFKTKEKNGTLNSSQSSDKLIEQIKEKYPQYTIKTEYRDSRYIRDDGYKYKCDIYIKELDTFIELNFHWSHKFHFYDKNNPEDEKLYQKLMKQNAGKTFKFGDPPKRDIAIKNKLNYIVVWDDCKDTIEKLFKVIDNKQTGFTELRSIKNTHYG